MIRRILSSRSLVFVNLVLLSFTLWSVSRVSGQQPSETIVIGGEKLALGMSREDATKKLEKCCNVYGGNDPRYPNVKAYTILKKGEAEVLGNIWFRGEKLERLERTGEFSQEPETFRLALSLYRLLAERTHSSAATILLVTNTSEMSNASSKVITFAFRDGRSVQAEIVAPDDPQKLSNQVSLKEILEKR